MLFCLGSSHNHGAIGARWSLRHTSNARRPAPRSPLSACLVRPQKKGRTQLYLRAVRSTLCQFCHTLPLLQYTTVSKYKLKFVSFQPACNTVRNRALRGQTGYVPGSQATSRNNPGRPRTQRRPFWHGVITFFPTRLRPTLLACVCFETLLQ